MGLLALLYVGMSLPTIVSNQEICFSYKQNAISYQSNQNYIAMGHLAKQTTAAAAVTTF